MASRSWVVGEVIVEDSQGKPDVALTKLRKLVENDKVQVLLGEVFAHIGYAMAPRVDEYKVPMLYPVIAADDLTQRKPAKWVVRTGWTSSQPSHPFGEWVYKTWATKSAVIAIGAPSAGSGGGFQRAFEEAGGGYSKPGHPQHHRLRPYLAQVRRDADAVFALMVATSALRF
jgi:branched-chain amino acid transport system substrate-binding protein